jgi:hypothetical protein
MAQTAYFGNTSYAAFVKAPLSGMSANPTGYSSKIDFLNGGSSVRRSNRTHREFNMSWQGQLNGTDSTQDLQIVKDFYDGIYGVAPFYWIDPFAMSSNVLPPHWAAPMLDELDWPSISASITPTYISNTYSNGYPIKGAIYQVPAAYADTRKLTILIPPTHTLNFGWHAQAAGLSASTTAGIRITPYNLSGAAQTDVNPASLLAGGTTRTNQTFAGSSYSRVEIFLANGSASSVAVRIVAMIAQLLPTGTSVATGGFISGRGTGKLEFAGPPTINYISSAINNGYIEMSANFVEVV